MAMKNNSAKRATKKRATFNLEVQHNGLNISTQQLESNLKTYLKGLGHSLTGCDLKVFWIPSREMVYFSLEMDETQLLKGEVSLNDLMA